MAASNTTSTSTAKGSSSTAELRTRLAQVVEVAFTLIAAFLVLAAILVALRSNINDGNPLVELVKGIANVFDGPFSRNDGILAFDGKHGETQNALANWGIAALVYLVVGRVLGKVIRP